MQIKINYELIFVRSYIKKIVCSMIACARIHFIQTHKFFKPTIIHFNKINIKTLFFNRKICKIIIKK